ncbi:MAG TPA: xanthine dehydrogenase accessory protein XdhC [Polyangiaceae bacterium]|jgi:xanthine dehydrogenase accessory factor
MWDWLRKLAELGDGGTPAALVTIIRCTGSTPSAPGAKMIVLGDGTFFGTIGGGHLEQLVIDDARACVASGESKTFRYPLGATAGQCCGGVVETFVDSLHVGPRLYLFGAGHVGQALCRILSGTPFVVHAVDEREEWSGALPDDVRRHREPWDAFVRDAAWSGDQTYVAIMTHRHDVDEAIVADVVRRPARYLGLIGSETKWRRFRERLEARGVPREALDRVKCPIGLDVGGKSPQEVAVSVAAELLSVHHGRGAGR